MDTPQRFPVGLCVAALLLNGLALAAAVAGGPGGGGVQWGAGAARPEILAYAWLYVNLMVAAGWFLLWPAWTLRPAPQPRPLAWELLALALAAAPMLAVAGWLSETTPAQVTRMLLLQATLAALTLAALAWRTDPAARSANTRSTLIAAALGFAFLGLPALAYLQAEFLPPCTLPWNAFSPALAIVDATGPQAHWWPVIGGALLAALLGGSFLGAHPPAKPAPSHRTN